jgi:preprotein translocase subunit SecF
MKKTVMLLVILSAVVAEAKKTNDIDFQAVIAKETQSQQASHQDLKAALSEPSSSELKAQEMAREDRIVIKAGEAHLIELTDRRQSKVKNKIFKKAKPLANQEKLQEDDFARLDKELELLK